VSTRSQEAPKVVPDPDGLNADFYKLAAQGTLSFQRCGDCGAYRHPPRYRCSACGSAAYEWVRSTGRGKVFSWTVTHRPIDPAWASEGPYATIIAELEEGVRLVGALRGIAPSELALELPVVAEIERVSDAFARIYFTPLETRSPERTAG
jgi:hypothetical protein